MGAAAGAFVVGENGSGGGGGVGVGGSGDGAARRISIVAKAAAGEHTKVVAVTLLTSLDGEDMTATGIGGSAHDQVMRLADLARQAGLDGIVCSGHEVKAAHKAWKDGYFVVPGLRPDHGDSGDQKRTMTPRAARDAGASVLVVGRPITKADDPVSAARAIAATL